MPALSQYRACRGSGIQNPLKAQRLAEEINN
ncbi:DUF1317 family protein [Escherichia coli]